MGLLLYFFVTAFVLNVASGAGVPLIIDTDASVDVDDVVAICMAHALMDRGEVDIKAIVHDAGIPEGIGAMSVLNHFYGRDDILLGAYKVHLDIELIDRQGKIFNLCKRVSLEKMIGEIG